MEYKNNHYVAKMVLKHFSSDANELFYFDKRKQNKPVEHRNTEGVFRENHLYTAYDEAGEADVSLERDVYRQLDDRTSLLIDKIVSAARAGKTPCLTKVEKELWDTFFVHQWQRTPDFHGKSQTLADADKALSWAIRRYENIYGPVSDAEKRSVSGRKGLQIHQSAKATALKKPGPRVLSALASRGIVIARISQPALASFIIGSLPIARFQHAGQTLDDPSVEAWFPIAYDVAISPGATAGTESLIEIDAAQVNIINKQIFRQSNEVAGRSRDLIDGLVGEQEPA